MQNSEIPSEVDLNSFEGLTRLFQFGVGVRDDKNSQTELSLLEERLELSSYTPSTQGALEDTIKYLNSLGYEGRFERACELIAGATDYRSVLNAKHRKTLLEAIDGKDRIRFSFSEMVLPCLRHAKKKQNSLSENIEIRFSGTGPDTHLMAMAALFLELPVYVETNPPWDPDILIDNEPDVKPLDLEVTAPPLEFVASRAPELEQSVRRSRLPRAVDRGKYDLESVMMNYLSSAEPAALAFVSVTFAKAPKQSRLKARQNLIDNLRIRRMTELQHSSSPLIAIETTSSEEISEKIRMVASTSLQDFAIHDYDCPELRGKSENVTRDEIKSAGDTLFPSRYLARGPTGGNSISTAFRNIRTPPKHRLVDLFEIIRPKALKKDAAGDAVVTELRPSDISMRGDLHGTSRVVNVRAGSESNFDNQKLSEGDVVFAHRGPVGRVCYITQEDIAETDLWAAQSLMIFRPRKSTSKKPIPYFDPRILYMYLSTPKVQDDWLKLAIGDRSPAIPIGEVERFALPEGLIIDRKLAKSKDGRYDPDSSYGQLRDAFRERQATLRSVRTLETKLDDDLEKVWDVFWPRD
ncbi:MAG: restriction endonuclease subunit S [Roseobacter sp.]